MIGTVLALGGGGFSTLDAASAIDDHLLALTGKDQPKVCFVPTASGDADAYIDSFVTSFDGRAQASVLSLFCHDPWGYQDPSTLLDQDVVYVGGGSTANLLAVWRLHGLPEILRTAAAQGTILAGISAGMNCWFEASSTDSFGRPLAPLLDGLGFLAGSACPHYLEEGDRRDRYLDWVASGALPGGVRGRPAHRARVHERRVRRSAVRGAGPQRLPCRARTGRCGRDRAVGTAGVSCPSALPPRSPIRRRTPLDLRGCVATASPAGPPSGRGA